MRRAARTDATQASIIEALKRAGVSVEVIGKPVDLLICCRGETALMECKTPASEGGRDRLTKDQVDFIARWPGTVFIVRSPEEAVRVAIGERAMA
jgi:hypothetical protein